MPDDARCVSGDWLPQHVQDRAGLVALGLVVDSGRRHRTHGRLEILWSISAEGRVLAAQLQADRATRDDAPGEEETRRVLQWLQDHEPVWGTRRAAAKQCATALGWPTSRVERCLLWAEVNGLVEGPDNLR